MGKKGDKLTSGATVLAEMLLERIDGMDGITSKKMFGGYGIFHDAKMFGIVSAKAKCFLKVNDETKEEYEALGSTKHSRMPYYELPESILDSDDLHDWVKKSIAASK